VSTYKGEGGSPLVDGWFPTGDVATIDPDGYMQITDRSKDVIKSGGEWISSIDVENIAMAHPAVAMAACIGMQPPQVGRAPGHRRRQKAGQPKSPATSCWRFTTARPPNGRSRTTWCSSNAIPLGGTGKMQKTGCANYCVDYRLPNT